MKRWTTSILFTLIGLTIPLATAMAVNSVVVASDSVGLNATNVKIGIFISNDDSLTALILPLVVRSVTGGAFWAAGVAQPLTIPAVNRVGASALGGAQGASVTSNRYPDTGSCIGGSCAAASPSTFKVPGALNFVSPDGLFIGTVAQSSAEPCVLPPGSDPAGTVNASFLLTFNVNGSTGKFEIDTACMCPANHLVFTKAVGLDPNDCSGGTPSNVAPSFTKGVIAINTSLGITSLESSAIPTTYTLDQNYPNPFNAGTVIRFNLPHDSRVNLSIYNILGQRVRTLADNEMLTMGLKSVEWDGRNSAGQSVPSGMYFYRLETRDFIQTRPMVLLK